jgi:hypothetical protein
MNCENVARLLPLHVGGDLTGRKAERVRLHLGECARCRGELETYQGLRARVRSLREEPQGGFEGFYAGIRERIRTTEEIEFARLPGGRRTTLRWLRKTSAAAALLLCGVVGFYAWDWRPLGGDGPPFVNQGQTESGLEPVPAVEAGDYLYLAPRAFGVGSRDPRVPGDPGVQPDELMPYDPPDRMFRPVRARRDL